MCAECTDLWSMLCCTELSCCYNNNRRLSGACATNFHSLPPTEPNRNSSHSFVLDSGSRERETCLDVITNIKWSSPRLVSFRQLTKWASEQRTCVFAESRSFESGESSFARSPRLGFPCENRMWVDGCPPNGESPKTELKYHGSDSTAQAVY